MPFTCTICEQESTKICGFCTKDTCDNHLCDRCGRCSDCCECDLPLDEATAHSHAVPLAEPEPLVAPESATALELAPEPDAHPLVADAPPAEPPETDEV